VRTIKGLLWILSIIILSFLNDSHAQTIDKAKIVDRVVCKDNPDQSYALYLPSAYTPQHKWPIIYAFDPQARGSLPVKRFMAAAEKYGYIIAGSNNSKNGPWSPVFEAMASVWNDTHQRFTLEKNRIYAAGFSGGARAASYLSQVVFEPITGVMAFGAGLPSQLKSDQIQSGNFLGAVGNRDFNHLEMIHLEKRFEDVDSLFRLLVFDGEHAWPPEEICLRSLEWMHLIAMKDNHVPLDIDFIDDVYRREMDSARELEKSELLTRAMAEYRAFSAVFQGLRNSDEIDMRMEHIRLRPDFSGALQHESKLLETETAILSMSRNLYQTIEKSPSSKLMLQKALEGLQIGKLTEKVSNRANDLESQMASRVLIDISLSSERAGWTFLANKDPSKALFSLQIALEVSKALESRQPFVFYGLACVYAQLDQTAEALTHLQKAVESGFQDADDLAQNEYLSPIRQHRRFNKILELLKKKNS
jgi:tetratricopeptide (TPR) repeat protein